LLRSEVARQSARQSERQVIPGLRNATLRDVLAGRYIMAFAEQGGLPVKSRLVVNPLHEQIRFFGLPFFERLDG
jgi:hypothetical protein